MKVTRRRFLTSVGLAGTGALAVCRRAGALQGGSAPWYTSVSRWGQVNMTEQDVALYDVPFWRSQWKRTSLQVILTNAVAGFATFPSRNMLVVGSPFAPGRDLMGEINRAARADGLHVVARMDSGIISPAVAKAYADWLCKKADGTPSNAMCPNSPYLEHHVFGVYEEVIDRYHVVGFADNGGVGNSQLCYCDRCEARYRKDVGQPLPRTNNLDSAAFRQWTRWNTAIIMENWDKTNLAIKRMGGQDCVYLGMVRKFSPYNREVAIRADLLLMDCQSRNDSASYREHVDEGRFMHSVLGWDKHVAVATSMTQHSHGYFRWTTDPSAEATQFLNAGIAGGFDPWWHQPTSYTADRRSFDIAPPVFDWHRKNARYLTNRIPIATAGIVRSDDNARFFGRDAPPLYQPGLISGVTQVPYRGMVHALFNSRVSFYPIHIADLDKHAPNLQMLVLPNLGGMSDAECAKVRNYVQNGGALFATGMTSLYDEDGEPRKDFALADVFGVHLNGPAPSRKFFEDAHTESYLRLLASKDGQRHAVLNGLSDVDLLAYGGTCVPLRVDAGREVPLTFASHSFGKSGSDATTALREQAALILGYFGKGKVAFLPVDLDRRVLEDADPDQSKLIGNVATWCSGKTPFAVEGPGFIGGYIYRQGSVLILHLFNGSGVDNGEELSDAFYPVGPIRVRVETQGRRKSVRALVRDERIPAVFTDENTFFEILQLGSHEVLVIS